MTTIRDSKAELAQSLRGVLRDLLPQTDGYAIEVDILENDRKKRSDAPRESWRPAVGEIRIRFGGGSEAVLGGQATESLGFEPVSIEGEPLSATVLGERR